MSISSVYIPFSIHDSDVLSLFVHHWDCEDPVAIVVIAHGMMEHGKRYARFAQALNEQKIVVFAPDHRGHGRSADKTGLGILGHQATWKYWVKNLGDVIEKAKLRYPNLPVFILGHSMGSFIAQAYVAKPHCDIQGLLLSGTTYEPPFSTTVGKFVTSIQKKLFGKHSSGTFISKIVFFRFCRNISTPKTLFDWLTRDHDEVVAYTNDPLCGQIPPVSFFYELFSLLNAVYSSNTLSKISTSLPIYLYSGTKDPLSGNSKKVKYLATLYRKLGHQVSETYYADGRHEMHHEINRDEVIRNVVRWIKAHV